MADTYTSNGITVTVADAERVAAWAKSLPQSQQGKNEFEWNTSPLCETGPSTAVALFFAQQLGLYSRGQASNEAGQSVGAGGACYGGYSFIYPDTFVGPVVISQDDDR
jgi:hypothetical protein